MVKPIEALIIYPMPKQFGVSIRIERFVQRLPKHIKARELVIENWKESYVGKVSYLLRQLKAIHSFFPDIIYSAGPLVTGSIPGLYAKSKKKRPLIIDWDDSFYDFRNYKPAFGTIPYWEYRAARKADAVLVVSRRMEKIAQHLRQSSKDIYYIPNGVDIKQFSMKRFNKQKLRKAWNIRDDDIVIFFLGNIGVYKDLFVGKELTLAAEEIIKQHRNIKFFIVGYGAGLPMFKEWVKQHELDPYFIFAGFVSNKDMPKFIALSDICVDAFGDPKLQNMQNRSSMKLKEYMSMEKPAIAINVGENITDLDNGKAGILIDYTVQSLTAAIERLISDPKLRSGLGKRARQRARQYYNLNKQAAQVARIIGKYSKHT
ncbi:glycosyltransferase family 4 protein [Candidatus Woesearchaeota archaeon]|nr:glycosyltransferase family 4 protein [Candidatus Woesearchaeota archaeon]